MGHLYVFFGKKSLFSSSAHFLIFFYFLQLSCVSPLYILNINPLCDLWFASIFSHSTEVWLFLLCWLLPLLCRSFLVWHSPTYCFWCHNQKVVAQTIVWSWYPCWRSFEHLCEGLFLGSLFCSIGPCFGLYASTMTDCYFLTNYSFSVSLAFPSIGKIY